MSFVVYFTVMVNYCTAYAIWQHWKSCSNIWLLLALGILKTHYGWLLLALCILKTHYGRVANDFCKWLVFYLINNIVNALLTLKQNIFNFENGSTLKILLSLDHMVVLQYFIDSYTASDWLLSARWSLQLSCWEWAMATYFTCWSHYQVHICWNQIYFRQNMRTWSPDFNTTEQLKKNLLSIKL